MQVLRSRQQLFVGSLDKYWMGSGLAESFGNLDPNGLVLWLMSKKSVILLDGP